MDSKSRLSRIAAQSYKLDIQAYTVRYAMLDWLQRIEMSKGLWRDVVRAYFEKNGRAVLGVVKMWKGTNKQIGSFSGNRTRPTDLEKELANALQATKQNRH